MVAVVFKIELVFRSCAAGLVCAVSNMTKNYNEKQDMSFNVGVRT